MALEVLRAAAASGRLAPGGTVTEGSVGSTGVSLATLAPAHGFRAAVWMPDDAAVEKVALMAAVGAAVTRVRPAPFSHPEHFVRAARTAAAAAPPGAALFADQFENPANPLTHERSTGPEIWEQMGHSLDAVVCGVGSGGTLTGLGRYFKGVAPRLEMVLADPKGSILAPLINDGVMIEAGSWLVEGIGEDFIPVNCQLDLVKRAFTITDAESIATARQLLQREGIICGSSSGTLIAAALHYCREQTSPKRVVSFVCDSGNKYLSKIYNEYWLDDHGFIVREETHDLRDLITHPHTRKSAITLTPADTLQAAYRKMKMYEVSQLPVMEEGKLVGIVSELDILMSVTNNPEGFAIPVAKAMVRNLVTIQVNEPITTLLPIFERSMVAIVLDGEDFLGLITPIDLLQYFRKLIGR